MESTLQKIYIGSDHISLDLKESIVTLLSQWGITVIDIGPHDPNVIVNYNDYAQIVAKAVASGESDGGIVICGTGLGASIAANKIQGIRAALCHDVFTAHQARAHNDANVLALGAWILHPEDVAPILDEWLKTPFEGGRHTSRVNQLDRFIDVNLSQEYHGQDLNTLRYAAALSVKATSFSPVLFSGRVEEGFAALHNAGFNYVELSLRTACDMQRESLLGLLDKYQLQVSALATGQGCIHDQLCLSNPDPALHEKAVKRMHDIIDLAHILGADVIVGGVRGRLSGSGADQELQRKMVVAGMKDCCNYAEPQGVTLLLEPINRYETNLLNTAAEALAFADELNVSNLKLLLDTFHMNIEEVNIFTTLKMTAGRLGYFHLADSNRHAPGQGHLDLHGILSTLCAIGYKGVVSAEILPYPDDASAVLQTANYLSTFGVKLNRQHVY